MYDFENLDENTRRKLIRIGFVEFLIAIVAFFLFITTKIEYILYGWLLLLFWVMVLRPEERYILNKLKEEEKKENEK